MKTNIYIDGFNVYYGCVKGTPYKWLNFDQLCRLLLPNHNINRIRYFTAIVKNRQDNLQKSQRQETYIRALETIPHLSVHLGHFLTNTVSMRLAKPQAGGPFMVDVTKTEEKGSDVNIATYLLVDGFEKDYDTAVIISNDSDLAEPIRIVRQKLGLQVGVLNPHKNTSWALRNVATFYRSIRTGVIAASQFPPTLTDSKGTITKPLNW